MSRRDYYNNLKRIGYEVMEEEGLPRPTDINFRISLNGTKKRLATCFRSALTDNYRILIHTVNAKYIPCDDGNAIDRRTGQKYRRVSGDFRSNEDIIKSLGHEMSHTRFWQHGPQHTAYTRHLVNKIKEKL